MSCNKKQYIAPTTEVVMVVTEHCHMYTTTIEKKGPGEIPDLKVDPSNAGAKEDESHDIWDTF